MTVTMKTADRVLKTAYLDVISEYLDYNANPFLAKIKKTTDNVWGREIKKIVKLGINGGVGAGTEDGDLPTAYSNMFYEFKINLKNLYGTIEISDKTIRASENKSGAITSILNEELEALMKAANFNFSRMLFGNGTGILSKISMPGNNYFTAEKLYNLIEGMLIQFYNSSNELLFDGKSFRILRIDRITKKIYLNAVMDYSQLDSGSYVALVNGVGNELTGLAALFDPEVTSLYGMDKYSYSSLFPIVKTNAGDITETMIQAQIDEIEDNFGGKINFILCSSGVKRALMNHLSTYKRNVETMDIQGGYKTMSFNGIPVVSDRFCPPGSMYLLNTDDFAIHQLCDWQWIEGEDGRILKQLDNKPVYRATLVKYAELLCSRPWAQTAITGITEA